MIKKLILGLILLSTSIFAESVAVVCEYRLSDFVMEVNRVISNKEIIDIQFQYYGNYYHAFIRYE